MEQSIQESIDKSTLRPQMGIEDFKFRGKGISLRSALPTLILNHSEKAAPMHIFDVTLQ